MEQYYISLDIGGTKTSGGVFTKAGVLLNDYMHVVRSKTVNGTDAVYENCRQVVEHLITHFSIRHRQLLGIGIGGPGPLDVTMQTILESPMIGLRNFPIGAMLQQDFGAATALDNDGNLGALAEQRCGLAKGLDNVVYMTVSTGIGGGIVLNGRVYRGRHGGAGELGHLCIDPEGEICNCGGRGCLELYASGTAMNRKLLQDMEKGIDSLVFHLANHDADNLNGRLLDEAANCGDAYALEVFEQEGRLLGRQTATIFNILDPDMLVIGGGVSKSNRFFHGSLMDTARRWSINPIEDGQVRYSEMNDRVILYGAYYLISELSGSQ